MDLRAFTLPALGLLVLGCVYQLEAFTAAPPPDGKIHVVYWEKWTNFEFDAIKKVVDTYNASQDKIKVDLLSTAQIDQKTLMAVSGRVPPDLAGLYGGNVTQYADNRAVMPLDDMCREAGIKRANYIPVFWDMCTVRGHVMALPTTPASVAYHYNRKMFRDAGLDPNKPPQTIEELDADCAKMTKYGPNGHLTQIGFIHSEPGWWNWWWGPLFGGKLVDDHGNLTANSPDNVRGFDWVQSYSRKYGAQALASFHNGMGQFDSPQNAFISEQVASEVQGVWMYNFIKRYNPKLDWAASPFPHPANRPDLANPTIADLDVICIPVGAKHPKEAFEFLKYLESQKGMEMLCLGQKKFSPLVKVSPEFYAKHPNKFVRLFADLTKGKNVYTVPKIGLWPEYQDDISAAFDSIVLMHKTAQEALDDVVKQEQPKIDDYNMRVRLREGP